jgi:hypothetical protein
MNDSSGRGLLVFAIVLGITLIFIALRFGEIGGGGTGASRDENPVLFWMGVSITAIFTGVAIFMLLWTYL